MHEKIDKIYRRIKSAEKISKAGENIFAIKIAIDAVEKALRLASLNFIKSAEKNSNLDLIHLGKELNMPAEKMKILRELAIDASVVKKTDNSNEDFSEMLEEIYDTEFTQEKIKKARQIIAFCEKVIEAKEKPEIKKELSLDIIAHDTLNPAGIIKVMSDLLLEEEKNEKAKELALKIRTNTEKLIEIIKNAKLFSELSEKKEISLTELNIVAILDDVIKNFLPLTYEKNLKIEFKTEKEEIKIKANAIIENVFSNLISNAIKYSPNNEVIEVKIEEKDKSLLISVADHGEGVKEEHKKDIFERFMRVEKAGVKGTGLGLAIAKRIVELHHGKIWVADNKPKGAIFFVELPKR